MTDKQAHIEYFDFLRLISAIAVILLHAGIYEWWESDLLSMEWQAVNVVLSITHFCVPIFFMISGALFLNPDREISIKTLYQKNIFRLFMAYFFWSLIYAILWKTINNLSLDATIKLFIAGPHHLWFLPASIILYMLIPPLRMIARDKTTLFYFTTITCFATFVLFTFSNVNISGIFAELIQLTMMKFPLIKYIQGNLVYFLLGYCLYAYDVPRWIQRISLPIILLSSVAIIILTSHYSIAFGYETSHFVSYSSLFVGLQSAFIFIFVKYNISSIITSQKLRHSLSQIAPYLFGVYLISDLFLILFRVRGLTATTFHPFIAIPIITILVFFCSLILTYLIKQIPVINKYLV